MVTKDSVFGVSVGRVKGGADCHPNPDRYYKMFDTSVNLDGTVWRVEIYDSFVEIHQKKDGNWRLVSKDSFSALCKKCSSTIKSKTVGGAGSNDGEPKSSK